MTPTLKRVTSRSRMRSHVTVFGGTTCQPESPRLGSRFRLLPKRVLRLDNRKRPEAGTLGADDGTRTHDLLHGKCARCSHPFAPVRSNCSFAASSSASANASAPERTPNLAIL